MTDTQTMVGSSFRSISACSQKETIIEGEIAYVDARMLQSIAVNEETTTEWLISSPLIPLPVGGWEDEGRASDSAQTDLVCAEF